jgi:hypothetical protein
MIPGEVVASWKFPPGGGGRNFLRNDRENSNRKNKLEKGLK